jgi:hypothetical protein
VGVRSSGEVAVEGRFFGANISNSISNGAELGCVFTDTSKQFVRTSSRQNGSPDDPVSLGAFVARLGWRGIVGCRARIMLMRGSMLSPPRLATSNSARAAASRSGRRRVALGRAGIAGLRALHHGKEPLQAPRREPALSTLRALDALTASAECRYLDLAFTSRACDQASRENQFHSICLGNCVDCMNCFLSE